MATASEIESDGEGFGDWIGLDQIRCGAKQRREGHDEVGAYKYMQDTRYNSAIRIR
jgi:hypothetical protein